MSGQGKSTSGHKNFYKTLGVSSRATSEEIERAYNKMIKDAHFDRTLNRKEIELAYLSLTDEAQKAIHDAMIAQEEREQEITAKIQKREKKKVSIQTLAKICAGLLVIAIVFFSFRFGHHLKSFEPGDKVYFKDSHRLLGTIVEVQTSHDFGRARKDAYKIQDANGHFQWVPQTDVKAACYEQ